MCVCAYFGLPFKAYSQHHRRDGLLISSSSKCIYLTALEAIPQPLISLPFPPLPPLSNPLCLNALLSFGKSLCFTDHPFIHNTTFQISHTKGGAQFDTLVSRIQKHDYIQSPRPLITTATVEQKYK